MHAHMKATASTYLSTQLFATFAITRYVPPLKFTTSASAAECAKACPSGMVLAGECFPSSGGGSNVEVFIGFCMDVGWS